MDAAIKMGKKKRLEIQLSRAERSKRRRAKWFIIGFVATFIIGLVALIYTRFFL